MPKLAAEDKTPVATYCIRLRSDVYAQIVGYGTYLNEHNPSTVGHVITEAFNAALKGDTRVATQQQRGSDQQQQAQAAQRAAAPDVAVQLQQTQPEREVRQQQKTGQGMSIW